MQNITKVCKIALIIIFIFGFIFSMFQLFSQIGPSYTDTPEIFVKAKPISNVQCYHSKDKYVYLVSPKNGLIQIFSYNGEFIKGFNIPSDSGEVWSGSNDLLYIYCVRSNSQITIDGENLVFEQNVFYSNTYDFYRAKNITNENLCEIRKNVVSIKKDNTEQKIQLKVESSFFSIDLCIILAVICIMGFLIVSGLLKKITER